MYSIKTRKNESFLFIYWWIRHIIFRVRLKHIALCTICVFRLPTSFDISIDSADETYTFCYYTLLKIIWGPQERYVFKEQNIGNIFTYHYHYSKYSSMLARWRQNYILIFRLRNSIVLLLVHVFHELRKIFSRLHYLVIVTRY